ncbi:hypothetical protein KDA00_04440 [Candidatus Saccharibacteria bacterium]|nr:hypothetical protein [Candidatus Saccharibacteria bacterium]
MLNGNRYDATTGELLTVDSDSSSKTTKKSSNIDGIVKPTKTYSRKKAQQISRPTIKSKTLMRKGLPKPSVSSDVKTSSVQPITKNNLTGSKLRESRAMRISQSKLISKFGNEVKKITKYSPISIVEPPNIKTDSQGSENEANPNNLSKISDNVLHSKSNFKENILSSTSHRANKKKKTFKSHKIAKKLRVSPRVLNISLIAFSLLILGGYFAYNNVPNLAMKLASTRSGISGTMPDYQPNGFALDGPLKYQAGQIVISFKSNSDDRSYKVTERNSEWNSDTLLQNHVAANRRPYQTFQDKGKTIYIYDGDSASWVDNGIWYEISGNSSLSTDQVLRIASSL